jgi:hypothetical protein
VLAASEKCCRPTLDAGWSGRNITRMTYVCVKPQCRRFQQRELAMQSVCLFVAAAQHLLFLLQPRHGYRSHACNGVSQPSTFL